MGWSRFWLGLAIPATALAVWNLNNLFVSESPLCVGACEFSGGYWFLVMPLTVIAAMAWVMFLRNLRASLAVVQPLRSD
jgi:hypothetical protein